MRRLILLVFVLLPLSAVRADALTLRELIELSRAGLGDDVLVALIEVEKSVFAIDHETIKMLKAEGLSERVMIAMIKSGRTSPPPAPEAAVAAPVQPPPAPQVVVIEHHAEPEEPRVREVAVPVPVYVAVPVHAPVSRRVRSRRVADPVLPPHQQPNLPIHLQQPPPKKAEPEYWGFGGKLRPDAWNPGKRKP